MKNLVCFVMIVGLFIACNEKPEIPQNTVSSEDYDALMKENLSLKRQTAQKDSSINAYLAYMNKVRENILLIEGKKDLILSKKSDPEGWGHNNIDLLAELENLARLKADNDKYINELKKRIKSDNLQINQFEATILHLSEEVQVKNFEIYQLQSELENMDAALGELFDAYEEKAAKLSVVELNLEDALDKLNKAWYTFGSKDELVKNGVVTNEGGVIGLGKIVRLKSELNKNYFTEVEQNKCSEIKIGAKKIEIISTHPVDSYSLMGEGKVERLVIKNPESFWSTSRYLVIVTK